MWEYGDPITWKNLCMFFLLFDIFAFGILFSAKHSHNSLLTKVVMMCSSCRACLKNPRPSSEAAGSASHMSSLLRNSR